MNAANQPEIKHLQLVENLDLTAAVPLHKSLVSMQGCDMVIDASAVERIGGQCVQLLLSARQSWAEEGMSFQIENASQGFLAALALLGVERGDLHVEEIQQ